MIAPPPKKIYLLDTSVLIDFAIWHPIPLCTGFWNHLASSLAKADWVLVDEVVTEIGDMYQPDLASWCKDRKKAGQVKKVSDANRTRGLAINKIHPIIDTQDQRSIVDTHLIAFAEEHGLTIFTREGHKKDTTKLNKIPDVCDSLKIGWIRVPEDFLKAISYKN